MNWECIHMYLYILFLYRVYIASEVPVQNNKVYDLRLDICVSPKAERSQIKLAEPPPSRGSTENLMSTPRKA